MGGRMPSLDGLRAISIALVLLGHLRGTRHFFTNLVPTGLAEFGVRVFFVISGFLITSLLLGEWAATRSISLRRFYLRRAFRIFPAFYVFLVTVLLLDALSVIVLQRFDGVAAATYTMNHHPQRSWWVGHLWSLSVEEQFYLLWPLIVALAGPSRAVWAAGAAVLAAPLVRLGIYLFLPASRATIGEAFPTNCDALAVGCLLACLRGRLEQDARYVWLLRSRVFLLLPPLALAASLLTSKLVAVNYLFVQSFCNIVIALSLHRWVRYSEGRVGRFLNLRPVAFVGVMSYSLYLWPQLFLNRHSGALVHQFPLNVLLAVAAALASYYLVERPFLRLRARRPVQPAATIEAAPMPGAVPITQGLNA